MSRYISLNSVVQNIHSDKLKKKIKLELFVDIVQFFLLCMIIHMLAVIYGQNQIYWPSSRMSVYLLKT